MGWREIGEEGIKLIKEKFVPLNSSWGVGGYAKADEWFSKAYGGPEWNTLAEGKFPETPWIMLTAGGGTIKGNGEGGVRGLQSVLEAFSKLPESERKPVVKDEDRGPFDPTAGHFAAEAPPPGGLILTTYCRPLGRDGQGQLCIPPFLGPTGVNDELMRWNYYLLEPQGDWMYLTESECKSLIPAHPKKGETFPVPAPICRRICLFYLINYFGASPSGPWGPGDLRSGELTLTVDEVTPASIRLLLRGAVRLTTLDDTRDMHNLEGYEKGPQVDPADEKVFEVGYDARLHGVLEVDLPKRVFKRFDVVALGDYWGYWGGQFSLYSRKRTPVGFSFELDQSDYEAPPERRRRLPFALFAAKWFRPFLSRSTPEDYWGPDMKR